MQHENRLYPRPEEPTQRRSPVTLAVAAFLCLLGGLSLAVPVYASFSDTTATSTQSISTGTVQQPSNVTYAFTNCQGNANGRQYNVALTWSAPPSGVAPTGYEVERTFQGTTSVVPVTGTSWTDDTRYRRNQVGNGDLTYRVRSVRGSWSSAWTAQLAIPQIPNSATC